MDDSLYVKIREDNIRKYGTEITKYGPTLLENLYSDRTHFVYELLQNAEDACERARKTPLSGQSRTYKVHFELYADRLEVRHTGIPFNDKDVMGICGLVEGTKSEDSSQIGKFGIGFKSVYAYTNSPTIYSGDKCFYIKDYVQPFPIKPRSDVTSQETLFVIPFNQEKINKKQAYKEVEDRLKKLEMRNLLFIKNIEEIFWKVGSDSGKYLRTNIKSKKDAKWVGLRYVENDRIMFNEEWLVFEKPLQDKGTTLKVEVAYLLTKDASSTEKIVPAKNIKLFAFFSTDKDTHLRFLIHGPYHTTPARDNIANDEGNAWLIEETADLVSDSISKIKELGLLDVSYLNTLIIDFKHFESEETIFKPIYVKVTEKISSNEPLLPIGDGSFTTANRAFLSRSKDLRTILSDEQLVQLFGKGGVWLTDEITEDKTPELREYLMNILKIEEIDPERFAKQFNEDFISKQSDEWVIKLYGFLLNQDALVRKEDFWKKQGVLRSKPIIRLDNDKHVPPFGSGDRPLAYLPSKYTDITKFFPTVKESIVRDVKAKQFLTELGLTEPDKKSVILDIVIPRYTEPINVPETTNIRDVEWISKTLPELKDEDFKDVIKRLCDTPFLLAINIASRETAYKKPIEIHLGKKYTNDDQVEVYFEGNERIWLLDDRYNGIISPESLVKMGCKHNISVLCKKPLVWNNHVIVIDCRGYHERGIDGFDPNCTIEELEFALNNITIKKSKVIWNIVKKCYHNLSGTVERSRNQNYTYPSREERYSEMGELLRKYAWLPDRSGVFHKPSQIMLSELPDDFEKESIESKHVAQKLQFKLNEEQELIAKLPDCKKKIYEWIISTAPETQKKILEIIQETSMTADPPSISDLREDFKDAIYKPRPEDGTDSNIWGRITPEEEVQIRNEYGESMIERLQRKQILSEHKAITTKIKIDSPRNITKAFLLEQYQGHCQICNVILDLGSNRDPFFDTYHLIKTKDLLGWSEEEFNVMCLCPNCHALADYGGRDFRKLWSEAKAVIQNEVAAELVPERKGDFYIVPISIAGKEANVYYTPSHMAKLAAFIKETEVPPDTAILLEGSGRADMPQCVDKASSPEDYNDEGIKLYEADKYGEAYDKFSIAAKLKDHEPTYHYNKSLALFYNNEQQRAISEIEDATLRYPSNKGFWVEYATICSMSDQREEVLARICKSLECANIDKHTFCSYLDEALKEEFDENISLLLEKFKLKYVP